MQDEFRYVCEGRAGTRRIALRSNAKKQKITRHMKNLAQSVAAKAQASMGAAGFFFEQLDVSAKKFKTTPITESSFSALTTISTQQPIVFVDGGNNTLIDSPSLHVSALRVAIVTQFIREKQIRFSLTTYNANVIISLEKIDGKKQYVISLSGADELPAFLPVAQDDELIATTDDNRVMLTICNYVRQSLEWHFAKQSLSSMNAGSLLVLDGSFSTRNSTQQILLADLISSATKCNVLVVALSKSSSLTTTGGYAFGPFLMSHSPTADMWMTSPLAESQTVNSFSIHFAKLATRAQNVVRIDVPANANVDVAKVFGILAWASQDSSFPGYPYGLIKADDSARVSQEDKEYLTTRLMMSMDPLTQKQIRLLSASSNAHSVLDSLKF